MRVVSDVTRRDTTIDTLARFTVRAGRPVIERSDRATRVAILWSIAVVLILAGMAGTVLPALPGVTLVFGHRARRVDRRFRAHPGVAPGALGVLTATAWIVDYAAAAMGAKRAGASRLAIVGAIVGTLAGVLSGPVLLPLVGATIGEYVAQRDLLRAGKVGAATWIGLLLGTAAKVAIVFAMVGIFVVALVV